MIGEKFLQLWRNQNASTIVEFALLTPFFFYLIFGIFEVFAFMLAQGILESAVRNASRQGLTGYTPDGLAREDYIRQQVQDAVFFIDPTKITFDTLIYSSFSNINQPEPFTDQNSDGFYDNGEPFTDVNANGQWDADMGVAGVGGAGDIVVYKVSYDWVFITPFVGQLLSDTGTLQLVANTVVKNEPF